MLTCRTSLPRRVLTCALIFFFLAAAASAADRGTVRGRVSDREGEPVVGATVLVAETQQTAETGPEGAYSLSLEAGEYTVLVSALEYGLGQERVSVAAGEVAELDFELEAAGLSQFGEELVVLGSRSRRTALETTVPVDVLSKKDLEETGMTETSRMLQFLAPSFNHSTSTISDGTDIVRPSTLRGLGPDQTLVLVNGKRRHNSALVHVNGSIGRGTAGVDLNAIPASAIGRIEVLRDGAAAQYGSDAIAGVINVELSKAAGTRVQLNAGQHYEGDGEVLQASVGHGWTFGNGGHLNLAVEYRDRGDTNRAGRDPRRIYNFLEQEFGQPALSDGTLDPREATYDRLNHRYGDASSENVYLFLNGSVPVGKAGELYYFGGLADRDGESAGFNRLPSQSRTSILIHPDGHLPLINTDVEDSSLSVGYRRSFLNSWSLDSSVTRGENTFNFFISNSANTSLGLDSPTEADAGELSFEQTTFNLDLFGVVGGLNLAFGAEYREDEYGITAGAPASYVDGGVPDQFGGVAPAGIQVFPGFRPSNEVSSSRDNVGLYGEIEKVFERTTVSFALRYEDYSDFGDNLSGKLALRRELSDKIALRGSVSTGFRAPSLHQQDFNNTSTQFVLVDGELQPLEVGTFRNSSAVAKALGIPALEEETSEGFSFGFTSRPWRNLSITADAFRIDIEDRIVITGQFQASNPQIAPILEPFGVNAAQFFTNAIDTETEGLDLVVAWVKELRDDRRLSLTGAANWNETQVVGNIRTPPTLGDFGETIFDRQQRVFVERGQPQELYNLSGRYEHGRWSSTVRLNKFGAVVTAESASDPSIDQTFTSKWLTDVEIAYRLRKGLLVAIGGNNVFDVYPDRNRDEISFNGIFIYPRRTAPFGFNGGYYYARASYTF